MINHHFCRRLRAWGLSFICAWGGFAEYSPASFAQSASFEGKFYAGDGDVEYLQHLDWARRMFDPDPEFMSLGMLYQPAWNGFVEGPTWGAWWVQNSYGTTYCGLPVYQEPLATFVHNAQQLWFDKMGDGHTPYVWNGKDRWVPPDGCLMDCANLTWAMHRQGDGRVAMHDWGVEFTAAGGLLQAEALLISRDRAELARYLPKLERCANFLETRRDSANNLFWAGAAGNLLAPSYAGWKKPDGTYGMAYLAGLSVTYIAFLDRLIELEKLAGQPAMAAQYAQRRESARAGLPQLMGPDGCFVKYLDPDGTKHGVYGAAKHGYFETSPNHDAVAFRVVDDVQSRRICDRIASIPALRPHHLILPNAPSLDDMYEAPTGLWAFGTWVNGGHWTTCEARMMLAYSRTGRSADALDSMRAIMGFARRFRMDNPLVQFGAEVYQPNEPINITYDAFGAPAGMIRGLFEYLYRADGLALVPHIPAGITRLEQKFPIRYGKKQIYLATAGQGAVSAVRINGRAWKHFTAESIFLPYDKLPRVATVQIALGTAEVPNFRAPARGQSLPQLPSAKLADMPPTLISSNALPVRIGADSQGGSRFKGDIARVAIFNRALSTDEIAALGAARQAHPALVADWDFSAESAGVFNSSGAAALPAKRVGAVAVVAAPSGQATRFGGEGFLEIASAPELALTTGGTWFAVIKPETTAGRIIDKCPVGGSAGYTFDTHPGNALRLITDAGTVACDAKLPPGQWSRVAATLDASGNLALYVNGQKVAAAQSHAPADSWAEVTPRVERLRRFHERMQGASLGDTYEAAHARLAVESYVAACQRLELLRSGKLTPLPAVSEAAGERLYLSTIAKLATGFEQTVQIYGSASDPVKRRIYRLWRQSQGPAQPR